MQETVCGCSGDALRENTRSCRYECPAIIRLLRTLDNGGGGVHNGAPGRA